MAYLVRIYRKRRLHVVGCVLSNVVEGAMEDLFGKCSLNFTVSLFIIRLIISHINHSFSFWFNVIWFDYQLLLGKGARPPAPPKEERGPDSSGNRASNVFLFGVSLRY